MYGHILLLLNAQKGFEYVLLNFLIALNNQQLNIYPGVVSHICDVFSISPFVSLSIPTRV